MRTGASTSARSIDRRRKVPGQVREHLAGRDPIPNVSEDKIMTETTSDVRPATDTAADHPAWCVGSGQAYPEHHDSYVPHQTRPTTLDLLEFSRSVFTTRVEAYASNPPGSSRPDERLTVAFSAWDHEQGDTFSTSLTGDDLDRLLLLLHRTRQELQTAEMCDAARWVR